MGLLLDALFERRLRRVELDRLGDLDPRAGVPETASRLDPTELRNGLDSSAHRRNAWGVELKLL